jgi:hypothetical protein
VATGSHPSTWLLHALGQLGNGLLDLGGGPGRILPLPISSSTLGSSSATFLAHVLALPVALPSSSSLLSLLSCPWVLLEGVGQLAKREAGTHAWTGY